MARAMLLWEGMKPMFLIAFLALVPALADQLPASPPAFVRAVDSPVDPVAQLEPGDRSLADTPPIEAGRALWCGR